MQRLHVGAQRFHEDIDYFSMAISSPPTVWRFSLRDDVGRWEQT